MLNCVPKTFFFIKIFYIREIFRSYTKETQIFGDVRKPLEPWRLRKEFNLYSLPHPQRGNLETCSCAEISNVISSNSFFKLDLYKGLSEGIQGCSLSLFPVVTQRGQEAFCLGICFSILCKEEVTMAFIPPKSTVQWYQPSSHWMHISALNSEVMTSIPVSNLGYSVKWWYTDFIPGFHKISPFKENILWQYKLGRKKKWILKICFTTPKK